MPLYQWGLLRPLSLKLQSPFQHPPFPLRALSASLIRVKTLSRRRQHLLFSVLYTQYTGHCVTYSMWSEKNWMSEWMNALVISSNQPIHQSFVKISEHDAFTYSMYQENLNPMGNVVFRHGFLLLYQWLCDVKATILHKQFFPFMRCRSHLGTNAALGHMNL